MKRPWFFSPLRLLWRQRGPALLLALFVCPPPAALIAQSSGEPSFDPCNPPAPMPAVCGTGERLCASLSEFPCSPGYCFDGQIPPNAGIPGPGPVQGKTFEINGTYQLTQSMVFIDCKFKMHGASRFLIAPNSANLAKIRFENCEFFGCDTMWYGIDVSSAAATGGLKMSFFGCTVEDAYTALKLEEGPLGSYTIFDNQFRNNYIGIANWLQNDSFLNAGIASNRFYSTDNLALVPAVMQGLPLTYWPMAYAGVDLVRTQAVVGTSQAPYSNEFSCLIFGIHATTSAVLSVNNYIHDTHSLYDGIHADDGSLKVTYCRFISAGQNAIYTISSNLTAWENYFGGSSGTGIWSRNNLNAEVIAIVRDNIFDMATPTWQYGIRLQRSQAAANAESNSVISNNHFNIFGSANGPDGINAVDGGFSEDILRIGSNTIKVDSLQSPSYGISVSIGGSDNFHIDHNQIEFLQEDEFNNFGIQIIAGSQSSLSTGHHVGDNTITGLDIGSINCGVHTVGAQNIEYCENTVDYSHWGLHFLGMNDVALRENKINHHDFGIYVGNSFVANSRIGAQIGRGNTWSEQSLDPDECINSIRVETGSNPANSTFVVTELNGMPYLPPNNKLFPANTPPWVSYDPTIDEDHCESLAPPPTVDLAPFELEAVQGISPLTSTELWDLNRKVYLKLLFNPSLRPSGSPEETFFNSFSSSVIAAFGQVEQQLYSALALSTSDQQNFDAYRNAISVAMDSLIVLDAGVDISDEPNLSPTYFPTRVAYLGAISTNAVSEASLENTRNVQVTSALQTALTLNAGIPTTQTWEAARKTLYDAQIRHFLGEPMTQSRYEQILDLAEEGAAVAGQAAQEAVVFLAPCDQALFKGEDGGSEERHSKSSTQMRGDTEVRIVPNPSSGLVKVFAPQGFTGTTSIVNGWGQQVAKELVQIPGGLLEFHLEQYPTGLYWLLFLDSNGKAVASSKFSLIH